MSVRYSKGFHGEPVSAAEKVTLLLKVALREAVYIITSTLHSFTSRGSTKSDFFFLARCLIYIKKDTVLVEIIFVVRQRQKDRLVLNNAGLLQILGL